MHTLVKQILFGNFQGWGRSSKKENFAKQEDGERSDTNAEMCLWSRNLFSSSDTTDLELQVEELFDTTFNTYGMFFGIYV